MTFDDTEARIEQSLDVLQRHFEALIAEKRDGYRFNIERRRSEMPLISLMWLSPDGISRNMNLLVRLTPPDTALSPNGNPIVATFMAEVNAWRDIEEPQGKLTRKWIHEQLVADEPIYSDDLDAQGLSRYQKLVIDAFERANQIDESGLTRVNDITPPHHK